MIMNCLSNYSIKLKEDQKWSCFGGLCGRVNRYVDRTRDKVHMMITDDN